MASRSGTGAGPRDTGLAGAADRAAGPASGLSAGTAGAFRGGDLGRDTGGAALTGGGFDFGGVTGALTADGFDFGGVTGALTPGGFCFGAGARGSRTGERESFPGFPALESRPSILDVGGGALTPGSGARDCCDCGAGAGGAAGLVVMYHR